MNFKKQTLMHFYIKLNYKKYKFWYALDKS
jgi:hypothetical protein